jgi:hypothetical protein
MKKKLLCLVFIFVAILQLDAATFYVRSATGNDTNGTGTLAKPWATLGKAIASASVVSGSIIDVSGTFTADYGINISKSITIQGTNSSTTLVDGTAGNASIKNFLTVATAGITVNIENVSFQNFSNFNTSAATMGGVISIQAASTLNVRKSVFRNNTGNLGGAIQIGSALSVLIEDSYFLNNFAKATTSGTTISNGSGGALYISTSSATSAVTINRCLFESNSAQGSNGSAINYSSAPISGISTASLSIINSTFANNSLKYSTATTAICGDAVVLLNGTTTVANIKLINNTICYNSSAKTTTGSTTGVLVKGVSNTVSLFNNILYSNFNNETLPNSISLSNTTGILLKESRNNILDVSASNYNWVTKTSIGMSSSNISGAVNGNNFGQLALAASLSDNGGFTKTLVLGNYSIANHAGYLSSVVPKIDQRGIIRMGLPDIGAFNLSRTTLYPSQSDSVGRLLCQSINLDYPGLEQVKSQALLGNYTAALEAWRDYKVGILRKTNLGPFGWHGNQLNSNTVLPYAQYMVAAISLTQFLASGASQKADFQVFGFAGSPDLPATIDWQSKNSSGAYPDVYSNFYNIIPLASHYYKTGEIVYLKKWFQVLGDFACKQKIQIDQLAANGVNTTIYNNCDWSTNAPVALSEGDRVVNIIRGLGVICKSLPNGGKPSPWDSVYISVNNTLPTDGQKLIPAVQLAQIVFSLVNDHPKPLLDRYLTASAVPNQRRNGLTSLLYIATIFPEFKTSTDLLASTSAGIDDYLTGAFYKDGGMLEASFNYNLGDAAALSYMSYLIKSYNPLLAQRLLDAQSKYYRLSASLLTPLGDLPALSSQSPSNPTPVWKSASSKSAWLLDNALTTPGQNDALVAKIAAQFNPSGSVTAPDFTSVRFPYSGYTVQRKNWQWDSPYLFFWERRPARGHTNMGANSIQVSAFGRPLLVTAGPPVYYAGQLPTYLQSDFTAINALLSEESSLKTNTVIVDGKSQQTGIVAQTADTAKIANRWHSSSNFDFSEGLYDLGYPTAGSVNHRRQVTYIKNPGFWIVAEIMTNLDAASHTFSQIWNFPAYQDTTKTLAYGFKQNEVQIDGNGIHTTDPTGPNIWLYHVGEKPLTYTMYFGQKNPYLGWFSPTFGTIIPAPQVFSKWTSAQNSVLITIIWPTPNNAAPAFSNLVNLSTTADPSYAGFTMNLQDGRKIKYELSHNNRTLKTDFTSFTAQSSLTISQTDGTSLGLVTAQTDTLPSVYEYKWQNGMITLGSKALLQKNMELHPMPFSDYLNISDTVMKVEVYSLLGKLLVTQKPTNKTLNFKSLAAGSYILKCYTAEGIISKSIIRK